MIQASWNIAAMIFFSFYLKFLAPNSISPVRLLYQFHSINFLFTAYADIKILLHYIDKALTVECFMAPEIVTLVISFITFIQSKNNIKNIRKKVIKKKKKATSKKKVT